MSQYKDLLKQREELEAKAKELGIQFGRKTTNEELGKFIQAKLEC